MKAWPRVAAGFVLWLGVALGAGGSPLVPGQPLPADVLPGPLRLTLRLAADQGRAQPLLAIGGPARGSLIFWLWDADGRARIGFEDTQQGLAFSRPFAAAPDQDHVVEVAWGALWPVTVKPAAGLDADLRDLFWISVDGQRLFSRKQAFPFRPSQVIFGANVTGSGLSRSFFDGPSAQVERSKSGLVQQAGSRLVDLLPKWAGGGGGSPGPLRLRLSLPVGIAGRSEPLLTAGKPGVAAFVYVRYEDEHHFRLGFDLWGLRGPVSEPIEYQPGVDHDLRLSAGFLYPPAIRPPQAGDPGLALLPSILWAEWDGRTVLASVAPCPPVPPEEITLGTNLIGWGLSDPVFRGLFSGVGRFDPAEIAAGVKQAVFRVLPSPGPAWQGYPGPVRMKVVFPEVWRPGTGDPLVVAGTTGASDSVFASYEDDGRVRLGVDRWGWGAMTSASLPIVPGSEHELSVWMGSLLPPEGSALYREHPELAADRNKIRVDFDGRTIISGVRPPSAALPDQITYGINLPGGSTSGPVFTGRILQLGPAPAGSRP